MSTIVHAPLYSHKGRRGATVARAQCSCGWQSSNWYANHQNARDEWNEHRNKAAREETRAED